MEYKKAGVDIQGSSQVKKKIKALAQTTYDKNVRAGIGPFGAMYDLREIKKKYKHPILVSSIDGEGTKLIIAKAKNSLKVVGMDLVNHCVNDILCLGAIPLYYKDYIAQDKYREEEILQFIEGTTLACKENRVSLIGGETAQMPGVYQEGMLDVVGEITGVAEEDQIIDGSKIKPGDVLLGLPSTGPHTNGYSLIRNIFSKKFGWSPYFWYFWFDEIQDRLGHALLQPHRSYLEPIILLKKHRCEIRGLAHITGGGLPGNLVRILPETCQAQIRRGSWPILPIFQLIQKEGDVSTEEMYQVFNMGIGMVLVVSRENSERIYKLLWENKEPCYIIGEVVKGKRGVEFKEAKE